MSSSPSFDKLLQIRETLSEKRSEFQDIVTSRNDKKMRKLESIQMNIEQLEVEEKCLEKLVQAERDLAQQMKKAASEAAKLQQKKPAAMKVNNENESSNKQEAASVAPSAESLAIARKGNAKSHAGTDKFNLDYQRLSTGEFADQVTDYIAIHSHALREGRLLLSQKLEDACDDEDFPVVRWREGGNGFVYSHQQLVSEYCGFKDEGKHSKRNPTKLLSNPKKACQLFQDKIKQLRGFVSISVSHPTMTSKELARLSKEELANNDELEYTVELNDFTKGNTDVISRITIMTEAERKKKRAEDPPSCVLYIPDEGVLVGCNSETEAGRHIGGKAEWTKYKQQVSKALSLNNRSQTDQVGKTDIHARKGGPDDKKVITALGREKLRYDKNGDPWVNDEQEPTADQFKEWSAHESAAADAAFITAIQSSDLDGNVHPILKKRALGYGYSAVYFEHRVEEHLANLTDVEKTRKNGWQVIPEEEYYEEIYG